MILWLSFEKAYIKGKTWEGALKDLLEGFLGDWRGFKGPRAQLAVAPDGNVDLFYLDLLYVFY